MTGQTARIFISTGEVSGDLQGALLVAALRQRAADLGWNLDIAGLGGDRMAAAGMTLLADTSGIGSVGLVESLPFVLPTVRLQQRVKRYLRRSPPDLVVLIDYMGPNLSLGRFVRRQFPHVPTVYYIAPQEWVWSFGSRNTNQLVNITDHLMAVFPEEARYYQAHGATVTWVGHPLVDRLPQVLGRAEARQTLGIPDDQQAIALLPASRRQEIAHLMPILFQAAQQIQARFPQVHYWIPISLAQYRPALQQAVGQYGLRATLVEGQAQTVIAAADLAIAKSGTVNLETALLDVPQIAVYRVHPLTAWIARHVLKFSIPFMSPPNLVEMEAIVPEFLQEAATPENIAAKAAQLLQDEAARQRMGAGYQRMRRALGEPGVCDRVAQHIFTLLKEGTPPHPRPFES
ncbi:MAG: lipid-A-disaccharide synthase [Synechococcales bacterium]|nr:lipid-A-disaccharide synthase [Synechococcales bacterium]